MVPTHHWLMVLLVLRRADTKGRHTWRDKPMSTSPLRSCVRFVHQFRGEIIAADVIKIKNSPKRDFPCSPAAARLTNHASCRGLRKRDGSHCGCLPVERRCDTLPSTRPGGGDELLSALTVTLQWKLAKVCEQPRGGKKHKIPCKEELGTKYCERF